METTSRLYCPKCGTLLYPPGLRLHSCFTKSTEPTASPDAPYYLSAKLADGTSIECYVRVSAASQVDATAAISKAQHHSQYRARCLHCGNWDCDVCPYLPPEDQAQAEAHRIGPGGPVPIFPYSSRGQRRCGVRALTQLDMEREYPDLLMPRQNIEVHISTTPIPPPPMAPPVAQARAPYASLPSCPCCGHAVDVLGMLCFPCANGNCSLDHQPRSGRPAKYNPGAAPLPSGGTVAPAGLGEALRSSEEDMAPPPAAV